MDEKIITVKIYEVIKKIFKKPIINKIDEIKLSIDSIPGIKEEISVIKGKKWSMNKINKIKDEDKTTYLVIRKEFVFNENYNDYYINLYLKK